MQAIWNDVVIAESDDTVVVEGNHYFPFDSIKEKYFIKTDLTTFCGWKGMANYYSVTVNGKTNKDCAWYYAEPNDTAMKIKEMVAFWNGVKVINLNYHKNNTGIVNQYPIFIGIGIGVIVIMGVIFGGDVFKMSVSTQDYAIYVDPLLDEQGMFTMGRVTIQNTGSQPLTNIYVNFGAGNTLELGTLKAGQKIIVSPPPENPMEFVMISADNDIFVNKAYREMPKMVGMMGS